METYKEYKAMLESKTVGILYHFTRPDNILKILNGNTKLKLKPFDMISYNGVISSTRNFAFADDVSSDFNIKLYNVRITLNGNKLSTKYKITPLAGFIDNDTDIFNKDKNNKRVKRSDGEAEESILINKLNIKDYIISIDVYNNNNEKDTKLVEKIKGSLFKYNLDIPVNLVRKFKPIKEDVEFTFNNESLIINLI